MRTLFGVVILLSIVLMPGCKSAEFPVEIAAIPEVVRLAAAEAVVGFDIIEAEMETTRDGVVYELEGTDGEKYFEIEVTALGEVLEVEETKRD